MYKSSRAYEDKRASVNSISFGSRKDILVANRGRGTHARLCNCRISSLRTAHSVAGGVLKVDGGRMKRQRKRGWPLGRRDRLLVSRQMCSDVGTR